MVSALVVSALGGVGRRHLVLRPEHAGSSQQQDRAAERQGAVTGSAPGHDRDRRVLERIALVSALSQVRRKMASQRFRRNQRLAWFGAGIKSEYLRQHLPSHPKREGDEEPVGERHFLKLSVPQKGTNMHLWGVTESIPREEKKARTPEGPREGWLATAYSPTPSQA